MYIGIAVVVFIIIFNIADRAFNKPKSKKRIEPRRVTMDSIEKAKKFHSNIDTQVQRTSSKSIEDTIENALRQHVMQCINDTPSEIKHSPTVHTLIIDSLANYAQSLIDNLTKKAEINKVFTHNQIESIVDNAQKKVLKEFLYQL